MKLPFLAALAVVTGTGIATHADERPATSQQTIDTSLERRIENALRDLEFNARALTVDARATVGTLERRIDDSLKDLESATTRTLKADEERLNALARKTGVDR
jgi:polyhydroxyalkanoate synthesis regulator phasin